jgi:S-DNA-T family DNA segregation ATPase FtsK/SpoIIIE
MPRLPGDHAALIRAEHVKVGVFATLAFWALRRFGRGFRILSAHPITAAALAIIITGLIASPLLLAGITGVGVAGLGVWRWRSPASYHEAVSFRIRGFIRGLAVYRRKWKRAMLKCGIITEHEAPPVLLSVSSSARSGVDTLRVRMPDGHKVPRYAEQASVLGPTFGGFICQVKPMPNVQGPIQRRLPIGPHESLAYRPQEVRIQISTRDVLVKSVPPPELDDADPFPAEGFELGLRGDSPTWEPSPFRFKLNAPTMIAGATQSGKTSLVRTLVRAMSPGIGQGLIRAGGINPKGDATLAAAAHLFDRYIAGAAGGDVTMFEEPITLELETWVKFLRFRAEELGSGFEEFRPSLKYPLLPLVIDEGALLVFYATHPKLRRRMRSAVSILASQGAGLGVIPVFLVQDPRIEIVQMRELFTRKIAMRGAGLVLTHNGELADDIPDDGKHQGYAFLEEQGHAVLTRWRAAYTTVQDVRMCAPHPALPPLVSEMRLSPVAMA